MTPLKCRQIAAAIFVVMIFAPTDAYGQSRQPASRQSRKPTAAEIAQLPKFCWAQLKVPNTDGDEFHVHNCGASWNHYCGGLLNIMRAKSSTADNKARMINLSAAANVIRYTENGIKDYPRCSIREHIEASKAEVLILQKVYGGKPSDAK